MRFGTGLRKEQNAANEPILSHLFLPFPRQARRRLALKRERKPTVRLLPAGKTLAEVPLTVLSSPFCLGPSAPRGVPAVLGIHQPGMGGQAPRLGHHLGRYRRGIQRQGKTDNQKSVGLPHARRHRIHAVSCVGEPTRARIHPLILLRGPFYSNDHDPRGCGSCPCLTTAIKLTSHWLTIVQSSGGMAWQASQHSMRKRDSESC